MDTPSETSANSCSLTDDPSVSHQSNKAAAKDQANRTFSVENTSIMPSKCPELSQEVLAATESLLPVFAGSSAPTKESGNSPSQNRFDTEISQRIGPSLCAQSIRPRNEFPEPMASDQGHTSEISLEMSRDILSESASLPSVPTPPLQQIEQGDISSNSANSATISPFKGDPMSSCTTHTNAMPEIASHGRICTEGNRIRDATLHNEPQKIEFEFAQESPAGSQPVQSWAEVVLEPASSLTMETIAALNQDQHLMDDDSSHYHDTDSDSALGDMSTVSSMTSVTSSIYESVTENGRTYHSYKPGKYVLPNDVKEQGRLDTQHYLLCEAIGGRLFQAPLEPHKVSRVLDIATGTGIWAIEFADDFPNAEVIGTDLTPIQPRWCPPNCHFEVDDAEDEWVYTSPFSYIHGRALLSCFENPQEVIGKCAANLEPGGWLEFQDAVIPFVFDPPNIPGPFEPFEDKEPDCVLRKWEKLTIEAGIIGRRPWTNVQYYKKWFEEAGLVDVSEFRTKLPIGQWKGQTKRERKMGAVHFSNIYHGLDAMTLRNFTRLGWTFEQSQALVEEVRKEMLTKKYKPNNEYVVVMGRKPGPTGILRSD